MDELEAENIREKESGKTLKIILWEVWRPPLPPSLPFSPSLLRKYVNFSDNLSSCVEVSASHVCRKWENMRVMFICCLVISCFALNCLVCSALAQKQMLFSRAGSFTVPRGAKWEASQAIQLVLQECWLMPTGVWQPQVLYRLLFYHLVVIQCLNPACIRIVGEWGGEEDWERVSFFVCLFSWSAATNPHKLPPPLLIIMWLITFVI